MRDRSTLHDRSGEMALGLILIVFLSSVFVAGLVILYLAKTEKFKVNEENIFLRIVKCAVISTGISLIILAASGAGYVLSQFFGIFPRSASASVVAHIEMLAPTAAALAFDLFVGLVFADGVQRWIEARMVDHAGPSGFASAAAFRLSLYLAFTTLATIVVSILRRGGEWHDHLVRIVSEGLRSAITPVFEIVQFIIFAITHPDAIPSAILSYIASHMSNVFAWTPLIAKWLLILTAFDALRRTIRFISAMRA